MKKSRLAVIISVVLVFTIFLQLSVGAVVSLQTTREKNVRFENLIYAQIAEISYSTREISAIKTLYDFSGNVYTLVELIPIGYMIFHDASGLFVEIGLDSPSPFLGEYRNLFYGGPSFYFVLDGTLLSHTIVESEFDVAQIQGFSATTSKMNEYLLGISDRTVVRYIRYGVLPQNVTSIEELVSVEVLSGVINSPMSTTFHVPGAWGIQELRTNAQMGFLAGGNCGYIAAGMLMLWHRNVINTNFITSTFLVTHVNGLISFRNADFTRHLISNHGSGGNSTAFSISGTLNSYMRARGFRYVAPIHVVPTTASIIRNLNEHRSPYILFGSLEDPSGGNKVNHAVLVYGHSNNMLIAHFGWEGFSNVFVRGIWGTGTMVNRNV